MRIGSKSRNLIEKLHSGEPRLRFSNAARAVLDLVLPPRCAWCQADEPLALGRPLLCEGCRTELLGRVAERCPRCGGAVAGPAARCPQCHDRQPRFDRILTLGSYTDALRQCVLRLKGPGNESLAKAMGQLLADQHAPAWQLARPDAVVAVPMHWLRRLTRRANNAELIATALAARLRLPLWHRAVRRVRNTRKQGPMLRTERLQNMRGAFRARPDFDFAGRHILIVDDILTTGATCNEIAKILKRAGASMVTVAVLARAETLR
jgi:ComF family protein